MYLDINSSLTWHSYRSRVCAPRCVLQRIPSSTATSSMGNNSSSIRVDKERRVWVRQRQQRPSDLRDNNPYPSYGTLYQEALPATSTGRRRRGQANSSEDLLPFYVPVAAPRHPTATHAQQSTSPQSMNPTHSIPVPYDTMLGQQAPLRHGPTPQEGMQQEPVQPDHMQLGPMPPVPIQSGPMQPGPMPPGPMPPDTMPPGPMQSGPMQSEPMPPGLMQPGPMQPMQPGPMQQGPFQQAFAPTMLQQHPN